MPTECVHTGVKGAQRTLEPDAPQERDEAAQHAAHPVREEQHREHDRPDDEDAFDPEVRADVVLPDGERKPDRGERQRRDAAERALEDDDRAHVAETARMAARALEDTRCIAADRARQHLAGGVRHEVGAIAPRPALVHAARRQQPLPPERHRRHAADHDRHCAEEPAELAVHDDVDRLADVELPEDVGEAAARDEKRQAEPDRQAAASAAAHGGGAGCARTAV